MNKMMNNVQELVRKGVTLLDETTPNWRDSVSTATLHMNRSSHCVLGQVYGSYWAGLSALDIDEHGKDYGFHIDYSQLEDDDGCVETGDIGRAFEDLQVEWVRVLTDA
jgi:hypothetical protein